MAEGRILSKRKKAHIPWHLRLAVIERDQCTCQYCGKRGEFIYRYGKPTVVENPKGIKFQDVYYNGEDVKSFEIDHIRPESKDGKTIIDNLILSCHTCNRKKGSTYVR